MGEYVRTSDLISLILKYKTGSWSQIARELGIAEAQLNRMKRGVYKYTRLAVADRVCSLLRLNLGVDIEIIEVRQGFSADQGEWIEMGGHGVHRITDQITEG